MLEALPPRLLKGGTHEVSTVFLRASSTSGLESGEEGIVGEKEGAEI